ncbi:uncharacterized protein EHS24_006057 [Apiotrichum porosum]|uniref:Uncharacterized protein n=1 Tax=Apiotrichum porosum TaxID=105984 RepID=A0A427Y0K3_9TREE|nr:uncharacterized protein EHS24_006057 [Apiotrichum porosum]RSH84535.1 hypothetical protein EHS24_006057 [Apiotrichum porosum]
MAPPTPPTQPEPPAKRTPSDTIGGIVHPLTVRQHLSFAIPALTICIGGPVAIGVVAYVLALVVPVPPLTQALNVVGCLSLGFLLKLGAMLCVPATIISVMHHQYGGGKYRLYCQVAAFGLAYWIMSTRIDELAAAGNQCQSRALGGAGRSRT